MGVSFPLYVHIPFCTSKCSYCDFFSVPCNEKIADEYIDAVLNEAACTTSLWDIDSWKTIYVGGGTPSLLSEKQIDRLFSGLLKMSRKAPLEVTMEVNPSDVTESLLDAASASGVTRISCGIQSFSDTSLCRVRRRSRASDVYRALSLFEKKRLHSLSVDMIARLPEETDASFASGLQTLIAHAPDHISLYSLTVEEGTPLCSEIEKGNILHDIDTSDALWISGRDLLCGAGYEQYEVSNFCRRGGECLHNLAYWNLESYAGIGAGATGTFYGKNMSARFTNTRDIDSYTRFWKSKKIDADDFRSRIFFSDDFRTVQVRAERERKFAELPFSVEYIDKKTEAFEFFMMGLRMTRGICRETYEARFGAFPEKAEALFTAWEGRGLALRRKKNGAHFYALTKEGLLFLNEFLEALL
ncbi:putative coproporphyrinogen dehydrogenase [Treponema socranskii subsp. socranskii VPI DR56BR1116 = ATCC 35536]|uniref:Heme chaperone HemW n=1 Tax=Treponema socranskii subsp. socranskii VPI DR56BR1116 = ATCC 35536 TaxID=1125725 RepID=U1FJQ0_TRESO|nr:radical SAM family heme chaperone HemW [Treponema socranskii]ERF60013.1 putative coproporphyrinogen dehydrogenase [Treponema socranskii subsp. socranskii VPI DR56BR1116 = ATCC 35536]